MRILRIVMAILLLVVGRQIFWLTVGMLGFLTTSDFVTASLQLEPAWVVLVIALVVGLIGALLAVFLQKAAAGFAGFLAGVYLVLSIMQSFGLDPTAVMGWGLAVVVGIIGAVLAVVLFDWAIIFLTSLAGSSLLVRVLALDRPLSFLLFIVLALVGIVVQVRMMEGEAA